MSTALITGIEGFTGHYLAEALRAAGFDVHGISFGNKSECHQGVYICDLADKHSLVKIVANVQPDVIVHLAAIAFVAHGDVDEMYRTNIVGTRNLLEAAAKSPKAPSAILLASSANIYGNADIGTIFETVAPAPANDYAVSKLAMEYMAGLWIDRLPLFFVRPFNYTGVGQSLNFLLPKIVDHFKRRAPILELGNLDVVRDFSDVRTVVQCYVRLLQTAASPTVNLRGEAYNICSGKGYSLLDVIKMAEKISGHSLEVKVNPAFVRNNEVKTLIGSRKKLEGAIGIVHDLSLTETLAWMLGN